MARRHVILGVALAATVAASAWLSQKEMPTVHVVAPAATRKASAAQAPEQISLKLSLLDERKAAASERKVNDVFSAKSWQPPPPPARPVATAPSAPPAAPPLPYTYLGKIIENGVTTVFLARKEDSFAVKAGDTLENAYRVDEIRGSTLTLVYLPLNQKQTLSIGESN